MLFGSWSCLAFMGLAFVSVAFGMEEESDYLESNSQFLNVRVAEDEHPALELEGHETHSPHLNDQQILDAWEQMHHLSSTRRGELFPILAKFRDEALSLEARFELSKIIAPLQDWKTIPIPKGLSLNKQKEFAQKKLVLAVYGDLFYTHLYWDFLSKSLSPYADLTFLASENEALLQQLLPRLAGELEVFFSFCGGDLKQFPKIRFHNEEFFTTLAIYKQCESLANHWKIPIPKLVEFEKKGDLSREERKDRRHVEASGVSFILPKKDEKAVSKSPFFAEKSISYHHSVGLQPFKFFDTDPTLALFQSYGLTPLGPLLSEHIQAGLCLPLSQAEERELKPAKATRKVKNTAKPQKKKSGKPKKQNPPSNPPSKPPSPKHAVAGVENEISVERSESEEEAIVVSQPKAQPKVPSAFPNAEQKKKPVPVNTPAAPTLSSPPKRLQNQEIPFHISYLSHEAASSGYTYNGKSFSFPFKSVLSNYDEAFLTKIKALTCLSPKDPDKLPNLATGWIRFHLEGHREACFALEENFLSGGRFFYEKDSNFKHQHHLINARQDMLTTQERLALDQFPEAKKGIPMGIAMEEKLRHNIMRGGWKDNALDSEALLLLRLQKKLPLFLRLLAVSYPQSTLTAVALGISSYKNPCPKCERLIQGFQHNLPYLFWHAKNDAIQIAPHLGSIALVYGHRAGRFETRAITSVSVAMPHLKPGAHALTCIHSDCS
jgi:hypothetical protein